MSQVCRVVAQHRDGSEPLHRIREGRRSRQGCAQESQDDPGSREGTKASVGRRSQTHTRPLQDDRTWHHRKGAQMSRFKFIVPMMLASLIVACGGTPQQQAQNTQPAANQEPQATPAQPPPVQQPPAPAQQPPAQQQPAPPNPAQQQPHATTPAHQQPAPAPPQPVTQMLDVPAGTVLTLAMDVGVNTKKNVVG